MIYNGKAVDRSKDRASKGHAAKPPKARSGRSRRLAQAIVRDYATVERRAPDCGFDIRRSDTTNDAMFQVVAGSLRSPSCVVRRRLHKFHYPLFIIH